MIIKYLLSKKSCLIFELELISLDQWTCIKRNQEIVLIPYKGCNFFMVLSGYCLIKPSFESLLGALRILKGSPISENDYYNQVKNVSGKPIIRTPHTDYMHPISETFFHYECEKIKDLVTV